MLTARNLVADRAREFAPVQGRRPATAPGWRGPPRSYRWARRGSIHSGDTRRGRPSS